MYCAQFESAHGAFLSAAIGVEGAAMSTAGWAQRLGRFPRVDVSLRTRRGGSPQRRVILLAADLDARPELAACRDALVECLAPQALTLAGDAAAYDRLAAAVPPHQIRVSHDGYHHQGLPLACEFRLYAAQVPGVASGFYQMGLRHYRADAEMERRVLKHLAWLELDRPFTDAVRAMQVALVQRLRQPGWIADEYLAFDDPAMLADVRTGIEQQFAATGGRVGFAEPPLEAGAFDDWLATGCLRAREGETVRNLPALGAALFGDDEVDWLFDQAGAAGGEPRRSRAGTAQVFISYASSDFARAAQLCAGLEARGIACWIAPRDIERELLPYTEAITRALSSVRAVVVVLSQMANQSVHIPRELDLALERRLPILPVRIENVPPAGQLNYLLRTCQWLNAFGRERSAVVDELLTRLRAA